MILTVLGDLISLGAELLSNFGSFIYECLKSFADLIALTIQTQSIFSSILNVFPTEFSVLFVSFITLVIGIIGIKIVALILSIVK